jgi:hypothetical protein
MRISLRSAFVSFAALAVIACTDAAYSAMLAQDTAQGASQNAPQSAPAVAAAPEARAPIDAAWIGAWIGEAATPRLNGRAPIALPITIVISAPAKATDAPAIAMTVIQAGAIAKPAIDVAADGRAIGFTLDGGSVRARFAAMLGEDGLVANGNCMLFNDKGEGMPPPLDLQLRKIELVSDLAEQRVYNGTLDAAGQKLAMRLALAEGKLGPTGAFEIAAQGLRDFAVEVEKSVKDGVSSYLIAIPVGTTAVLELTANADASALEGTFTQGAFKAPMRFELQPGVRLGTLRRPQDPVAPLPYREEDVRIPHAAGHALSGTLTIPSEMALARDGRVPAVVLVTGSGPQDRDEALMGHRPFLVIADALTRAGVAVLRYDDRGVARSTGDFTQATTLDFASDAETAVDWLKTQASIDPTRIGLIGHSEGGLIAPIVAMWENEGDSPTNPLAFMVLLAGTAEQGGKLLTRQSKALYDAAGVPAEKSGPALTAHAAAMSAVIEGKPIEEVRPLIEEMVRRQVAIGSLVIPDDATLKPTFDAAMTQISSPWMMEFIRFDPRGVLTMIEIPTLALCGSKDTQVDMETNLSIMEEVARASAAPITTRRLEGLNHLFQPAQTGVIDEYGTIDTTFEPKALADLVAWVVETAKAAPAAQVPDAKRPAGWSRPAANMLPARPEVKPPAAVDPAAAPAMPTRRGIGGGAAGGATGGTAGGTAGGAGGGKP